MAERKISTSVSLTPQQDEELRALHRRTKVPMAELIRQGVDMLLALHRSTDPDQRQMLLSLYDSELHASLRHFHEQQRGGSDVSQGK